MPRYPTYHCTAAKRRYVPTRDMIEAANRGALGRRNPPFDVGLKTELPLLINPFELLLQFNNQAVDAFLRHRIGYRSPCKRPVFHDLHFEFYAFVL